MLDYSRSSNLTEDSLMGALGEPFPYDEAAARWLTPVDETLPAFEDVKHTRRALEPRRIPGACLSRGDCS